MPVPFNTVTYKEPAQQAVQKKKKQAVVSSVVFPSDLGDFFMSFDFYDYRDLLKGVNSAGSLKNSQGGTTEAPRAVFNANKAQIQKQIASKGSFARISLPIPKDMVDNFRVAWETSAMGMNAGLLGEAFQGGSDLANAFGKGMDAGINQLKSMATTNVSADNYAENTAGQAGLRLAAIGLGQTASDLIDLSTGVATNPNLAVLFKGPTLKQHRFTWMLQARTPQESKTIQKIIAIFKRAMHPQQLNATTTAFLKYPSECLVEFHGGNAANFLYPIRPCVVEDFSNNYAPNGMPAFFQGTNDPVSIEIAVSLQETSYYLRNSFDDKSEYGSDGFDTNSLMRNPTGSDEEELDT